MKKSQSILGLLGELNRKGQPLVVATHDGIFHLDETLCLAMLKYLCDAFHVVLNVQRSRDLFIVNRADIAIDVGMKYEPEYFRFDHHQKGGAGCRKKDGSEEDGTPFSSIGLFWKHFGEDFCKVVLNGESRASVDAGQLQKIWKKVDRLLIEGVDALDTGSVKIRSKGLMVQSLSSCVSHLNPVQIMYASDSKAQIDAQKCAVAFLKQALVGFVMRATDSIVGMAEVGRAMSYSNKTNSRILVLDSSTQAWRGAVVKNPKLALVIQPQLDDGRTWGILVVERDENQFQFPEDWGGCNAEELVEMTGIEAFTFCHDAGFFAATRTRESALAVAELALGIFDKSCCEVTES
ncbi:MAG: hypothetical protein QG568_665 [Patescibacteria group bacterium]|nr:hypothetical protein [Patescibacteria group bacterium]